ncbi:hypothetical protein CIPAW_11G197900 [Carya illinoinensis]|uniref:Uncharacterized protein n=1 Tax=Carya illinoinensis TaxID=32201 RepID=A0A8T1P9R4_CARIL|nr:hypothetical protein CIPAW_11G197900 [Carya illinoinensis]
MIGCDNLSSNLSTNLLQYPSTQSAAPRLFCLPGSEVPNWFGHQRIGSSISFRVPSLSEDFPEKEMEMVSGEEIEVSFNNSSSANFEPMIMRSLSHLKLWTNAYKDRS